jgi:hypothetical protein
MEFTIIIESMPVDDISYSCILWGIIKAIFFLYLTVVAVAETARLMPSISPIVYPALIFVYLRWAFGLSLVLYLKLWAFVLVVDKVYYYFFVVCQHMSHPLAKSPDTQN